MYRWLWFFYDAWWCVLCSRFAMSGVLITSLPVGAKRKTGQLLIRSAGSIIDCQDCISSTHSTAEKISDNSNKPGCAAAYIIRLSWVYNQPEVMHVLYAKCQYLCIYTQYMVFMLVCWHQQCKQWMSGMQVLKSCVVWWTCKGGYVKYTANMSCHKVADCKQSCCNVFGATIVSQAWYICLLRTTTSLDLCLTLWKPWPSFLP